MEQRGEAAKVLSPTAFPGGGVLGKGGAAGRSPDLLDGVMRCQGGPCRPLWVRVMMSSWVGPQEIYYKLALVM